ncbi:MAG TPA: copper resistance protein CopC [Micropepsaceae bacterium]|nr:copper resistance protein CopC [Micropepsaceae bacterium]
MRQMLAVMAVCFVAIGPRAEAHAFLVKALPAVGSTVERGPSELRLEFSEAVELVLSGVNMTDARGAAVPLPKLQFGDPAHRDLVAGLPMLMPGSYRVSWHVVSADTHRTEGSFTFTVKP